MQLASVIGSLIEELDRLPQYQLYGRVAGVLGLRVEVAGLERALSVGSLCKLVARDGRKVICEVVGFHQGRALLLPFGSLEGVGLGCKAELITSETAARPSEAWLGRVVNALGAPLDDKGPLPPGRFGYPLRSPAPPDQDVEDGSSADHQGETRVA